MTPFSSRAMDRGLAGALVAFARHKDARLTSAVGVRAMETVRPELAAEILAVFEERVRSQTFANDEEREERLNSVRHRIGDLLDSWTHVIRDYEEVGESPLYQRHEPNESRASSGFLREMLDSEVIDEHQAKFRVNRSLRDVEAVVNVYVKDLVDIDTGGTQ